MQQIRSLLTLILIFSCYSIFACDCGSAGTFLTVAPKSNLVALIKISRYLTFKNIDDRPMPMSMEVELLQIYKGKESRKTFTVWGDNGALFRPYLSTFPLNQYFVIAFDKGSDVKETNANQTEKKSDYSISVCGDYWLTADITKQLAKGRVTEKRNQISLYDLKRKLTTK